MYPENLLEICFIGFVDTLPEDQFWDERVAVKITMLNNALSRNVPQTFRLKAMGT